MHSQLARPAIHRRQSAGGSEICLQSTEAFVITFLVSATKSGELLMSRCVAGIILLVALADVARAAPVATYQFNNTFGAAEAGRPALFPISGATSLFQNDLVFGQNRRVWSFNGFADPHFAQAGLLLDTSTIISPSSYSVEMIFRFTEDNGSWRRVIETAFQQSDNGLYVEPANNLQVYPDLTGVGSDWTEGEYHHMILTNDGNNVAAYLDGELEFAGTSTWMRLDNASNPGRYMVFFVDNSPGTGVSDEYANGRVSLIRLWNHILTAAEAQQLSAAARVPEPASAWLVVLGLAMCFPMRRSR